MRRRFPTAVRSAILPRRTARESGDKTPANPHDLEERMTDPFGARSTLTVGGRRFAIHRLDALERAGLPLARLPYSMKILLENLLRRVDGRVVRSEDVEAVARWNPDAEPDREIAIAPAL